MGRWITEMFTTRGTTAFMGDDGCPICDHPFGNLTHACISSIGPVAAVRAAMPISMPVAVVA